MSVQVQIPDAVAQAIRLPEERMVRELLVELAIALYAQRLLSFGKARELAGMGKYEFGRLLGERRSRGARETRRRGDRGEEEIRNSKFAIPSVMRTSVLVEGPC